MLKGSLIMWNDQKGFGFIRLDGGEEDYFVHISSFKKGMSRRPVIGDSVQFHPANDSGKKRATYALLENVDREVQKPVPFELKPVLRPWYVNVLIAIPLLLSGYMLLMAKPLPFFCYLTLSILTMFLYGLDKANAAMRKWRVPEVYFYILELMGGWPGALIAQNDLRHKTRQTVYLMILRGIIALHLSAWVYYFLKTAR